MPKHVEPSGRFIAATVGLILIAAAGLLAWLLWLLLR